MLRSVANKPIMLIVIMVCVVMLSVIMQIVIMQSGIMLSVVAPAWPSPLPCLRNGPGIEIQTLSSSVPSTSTLKLPNLIRHEVSNITITITPC
jgi:hypothetical protein